MRLVKRPAASFIANKFSEECVVKEGSASISLPKGRVFYNPVQEFNRDLSIAVISTFSKEYLQQKKKKNLKGITILEALSATGLRSIRYSKEIPNVVKIFANDIDPTAVDLIRLNIQSNHSQDLVEAHLGDANSTMHKLRTADISLDVIDLDPYGSAAPFIDSAVQSIADGGLICVTCTDLAILCSTHPETCFSKYGGLPTKGDVCHESALRLVLQSLEISATRYGKSIEPLLSCSIDFYVRLFVKVKKSALNSKMSSINRGLVIKCVQCSSIEFESFLKKTTKGSNLLFTPNTSLRLPEICNLCKSRNDICGPTWIGPIHNTNFASDVISNIQQTFLNKLATYDRILGLLTLILEELHNPFFMSLPEMSRFLKCSVPPLIAFRSAILNHGFDVSNSHCKPQSIKSNCDTLLLWKIIIDYIKKNQLRSLNYTIGSPQSNLIEKCSENISETSFSIHEKANPPSRASGLLRFQENPTENWGPLGRANSNTK